MDADAKRAQWDREEAARVRAEVSADRRAAWRRALRVEPRKAAKQLRRQGIRPPKGTIAHRAQQLAATGNWPV